MNSVVQNKNDLGDPPLAGEPPGDPAGESNLLPEMNLLLIEVGTETGLLLVVCWPAPDPESPPGPSWVIPLVSLLTGCCCCLMPTPPFIFSGHKKRHNAFYRIFNTALDFSLSLRDLSRLRRLLALHCWLAHPGDKLDQKLFPDSSDPEFPEIFLIQNFHCFSSLFTALISLFSISFLFWRQTSNQNTIPVVSHVKITLLRFTPKSKTLSSFLILDKALK